MVKKKSASSQHQRRIAANELFTMPLNEAQQLELRNLAALPDARIDYSDAPAAFEPASDVQRGRFYRPLK
jgi:hypothetical protein